MPDSRVILPKFSLLVLPLGLARAGFSGNLLVIILQRFSLALPLDLARAGFSANFAKVLPGNLVLPFGSPSWWRMCRILG